MNVASPRRHVLLWGMMGSGKSSVGPLLAAQLNHAYVDLDREIEAEAGVPIAELFDLRGEADFRRIERTLLLGHLTSDTPKTIALGGGALVDNELRMRARAAAYLVCLQASVHTLAKRVGDGAGRPLLAGDSKSALERVSQARGAAYADVDLVIATDLASPDGIATSVAAAVRAEDTK